MVFGLATSMKASRSPSISLWLKQGLCRKRNPWFTSTTFSGYLLYCCWFLTLPPPSCICSMGTITLLECMKNMLLQHTNLSMYKPNMPRLKLIVMFQERTGSPHFVHFLGCSKCVIHTTGTTAKWTSYVYAGLVSTMYEAHCNMVLCIPRRFENAWYEVVNQLMLPKWQLHWFFV